jgi:hypothetical protein
MLPAMAGEDQTDRSEVKRQRSRPVATSTAWTNLASELLAYTNPAATAGDVIAHDISWSTFHRSRPVLQVTTDDIVQLVRSADGAD